MVTGSVRAHRGLFDEETVDAAGGRAPTLATREDSTRRGNEGGARVAPPPRLFGRFSHCAYSSLIAPIRPMLCPFVPDFDPFVTFFSGT